MHSPLFYDDDHPLSQTVAVKRQTKLQKRLYCDGWCYTSNPSPKGGGFTICNQRGWVLQFGFVKKAKFTNNEAELLALKHALLLSDKDTAVSTDSMNTLNWIKAGFSNARPDLNSLISEVKALAKGRDIIFQKREKNKAGWYNERAARKIRTRFDDLAKEGEVVLHNFTYPPDVDN